jgi:glycerol-3-phosphate dehydrogenase
MLDGVSRYTAQQEGVSDEKKLGWAFCRHCRCVAEAPPESAEDTAGAISIAEVRRAIDLCNGADPVCSRADDLATHRFCAESEMATQAAEFVAHRLNGCMASASGTADAIEIAGRRSSQRRRTARRRQ